MSDSAHAPLPPSSAWIWVACPAQPLLLRKVPALPRDDEPAREGTAAHWAGEELIRGRIVSAGDQIAPNGVILTEALVESAQVWADHVQRILGASTTRAVEGQSYGIEDRVRMPMIHADNWGTPDFWHYDVNARTLHLSDLKNGHGIVEVFENWQLLDYAAGVLAKLTAPLPVQVVFTVVQPNAYHRDGPVRSWTVPVAALDKYWHTLSMAAEDAMSGTAKARPGPQCRYCDARHACESLQRDAYHSADLAREAAVLDLPPAPLGLELAMLTDARARLDARITGLEAQAEAVVRGGAAVPGWSMQAGESRMKWVRPMHEVLALGKLVGKDLAKPPEPITPAQAKAKGVPAPLIDAYAARPPAAMKLTRVDESFGRRVFSIAPTAN